MSVQSPWLDRIQAIKLPVLMQQDALPGPLAPLTDWIKAGSEDPLLAMQIFRYANQMMSNRQVLVRTLEHAVALIGSQRLQRFTEALPRVEPGSMAFQGLQNTVGDSLVAASLMRQWFELRQIPWTEADYWMTLFYDAGLWALWLLEPQMMEGFEFRAEKGENRSQLMEGLIGMPIREWNEQLCRHFQLPAVPETGVDDDQIMSENRIQPHKLSALKFFLPFSHELAYRVRLSWESEILETLCRTGEIALGLTEFRPMLKRWITSAAREYQLPQAATAARRLLAQQPAVSTQKSLSRPGFSAADLARAAALGHADQDGKVRSRSDKAAVSSRKPDPKAPMSPGTKSREPARYRHSIQLNSLREIRRQFRNKKTWHSPVEIQESALYGLQQGLGLHRIVVMEYADGSWRAFDSEGCDHNPGLKHLTLTEEKGSMLAAFSNRVTATWVHKGNLVKAARQLPANLFKAADGASFFLRSFNIGDEVTMLIYADANDDPEPLSEQDYQLFREFCADWNTALNRIRQ